MCGLLNKAGFNTLKLKIKNECNTTIESTSPLSKGSTGPVSYKML